MSGTETLYQADIEFQDDEQIKEGICSGTRLLFVSGKKSEAVADVFRWFDRRHAVLPPHFAKLCAVKLYSIVPQRIDDKGSIAQDHGLASFEWKCDGGYTRDMAIDRVKRQEQGR